MLGFEPSISGDESDLSTNCIATTAMPTVLKRWMVWKITYLVNYQVKKYRGSIVLTR